MRIATTKEKNWTIIILSISFVFGFLIRLPFLLLSQKGVNSDQAMGGLMGIHILRGDFPIFWWGQGYMGPIDSYLNAVITYIFGLSNINSLIIPFLFSLLFPFSTYLLAKEVLDKEVAILSFVFASIPTVFFTVLWVGTMGYMIPITIGSFLLLVAIQIQRGKETEEENYRKYITLGFLGGLGFWINWLILPYLSTIGLVLFIKNRVFFLKKTFLFFSLSFLIGSLPFWIFNLNHQLWTFALFHGAGQREPILAAKALLLENIPLFFGLKFVDYPWSFFKILIGIIYILLFIFLIIGISRMKSKMRVLVLIAIILLVCFSFVFSRFGGLGSPRYLTQLYSVLPILIAFSLLILKKWSRVIFYIICIIIISGNLYAAATWYIGSNKPSERDPDTKELIQFLRSEGIQHAYSDYTLSPRLTFESKEEIICAEPTTERYRGYKEILNSSRNFAYVFRSRENPYELSTFEDKLKVTGIGYYVDDVDNFRVFHSFSKPSPVLELSRHNWRAVSFRGEEGVFNAFDGDIESAWFSGEPKREGMWFRVDLGGIYRIAGLSILPGLVPEGNMSGYSIEVSKDGRSWVLVSRMDKGLIPWLSWRNGGPRFEHPRVKVAFSPVDARYIRITQHGEDKYYNWTIAELFVYTPIKEEINRYGDLIDEGRDLEAKGEYRGAMIKYLDAIKSYGNSEEGYYRLMALMQDLHIPLGPIDSKAEAFENAGLIEKAIENYENEYRRLYPSGSYSSVLLHRLVKLYEKLGDIKKSDYFRKRLKDEFSPAEKRSINFGGVIEFLGYDIKNGNVSEIVYYWKVIGDIKRDWKVFVHFIGSDGRVAFQEDHILFSGDKPASQWIRGEIYKERVQIKIPEKIQSETYVIRMGLWIPEIGERLKVREGYFKKVDTIKIGELRIGG